MAFLEELDVAQIIGGSQGQDRIVIPNSVQDTCKECGLFQRFSCPSPARGGSGYSFSFSSKCAKCSELARFIVSYPEQETGPIIAVSLFRLVEKMGFASTSQLKETDAKISERYQAGDHDGAITSCYTLLERLLKVALVAKGITFKATEGDIRKLFANFQTKVIGDRATDIPTSIKTCLNAQMSLVGALYDVANKLGDRHHSLEIVGEREAKIVMSATRSLAEFIESF